MASIALYRLSFPVAAGGSGSRCTLCTKVHRESMLAIYSINILIYNEKMFFRVTFYFVKNFVSFSKTRKSNEMMQKHKCLIDFILTVASQIAYADLPLSLEELLTDKGKFKLESSISYINTERNQSEFANPIYVQTSATKIATVMAMMITPVMAQNLDSQVFDSQNVKAIQLSQAEMKETQGEFVPIIAAAAFGGALGAWGYHGANLYNHGKLGTAQGAATAAGIGAATGVAATGLAAAAGGGLAGNLAWRPGIHALGFGANAANNAVNSRKYSGLTKTSTALPRLAVLVFVNPL
ncbi:TPA: hypothetical protein ACJL58_000161 [Neisseria meningitidis]|uniref:hypothetical protein n=1 Tax=Neisseria meningitidis TaxID=487 RepID=UPI001E62FCE1|nr:hypothetical protein [Neisseria meningitidis]MDA3728337.1 hypothetical protein [Neisseria meningitidis]